jgi:phosphohistidine phosphatase
MTRTLMLVRHAKAGGGDGGGDIDRPITQTGKEQCRVLGREIDSMGLCPDLALVSTARRARQTYDSLALAAAWNLQPSYNHSLYTGYVDEVLSCIRQADPAAQQIMVVGHEPTMSATAYKLAGRKSQADAVTRLRRGLPTGSVAIIQVDGSWEELTFETGRLRWVLTPLA